MVWGWSKNNMQPDQIVMIYVVAYFCIFLLIFVDFWVMVLKPETNIVVMVYIVIINCFCIFLHIFVLINVDKC